MMSCQWPLYKIVHGENGGGREGGLQMHTTKQGQVCYPATLHFMYTLPTQKKKSHRNLAQSHEIKGHHFKPTQSCSVTLDHNLITREQGSPCAVGIILTPPHTFLHPRLQFLVLLLQGFVAFSFKISLGRKIESIRLRRMVKVHMHGHVHACAYGMDGN